MPQAEPTYVLCDNESVVKNTTNVESTLNKNTQLWHIITLVGRELPESSQSLISGWTRI